MNDRCSETHQGDRCDGPAGHQADRHWHVDPDTGEFVFWQDEETIRAAEAVRAAVADRAEHERKRWGFLDQHGDLFRDAARLTGRLSALGRRRARHRAEDEPPFAPELAEAPRQPGEWL